MTEHEEFMRKAIEMAKHGMRNNLGGPFGAIIVKEGKIIASAHNEVTSSNDPTAHAEVVAIRKACATLGDFQLNDCVIYTSCEPCPMCLGAIYWARPKAVYFGSTKGDAAEIEFDDQFIYDEIDGGIENRSIPFTPLLREEAQTIFNEWASKLDKTEY